MRKTEKAKKEKYEKPKMEVKKINTFFFACKNVDPCSPIKTQC